MKWIKILDSFPVVGEVLKLKVLNKSICVLNNEGKIFAFAAKCPHAGANLTNGWVDNDYWVCPIHRYKYNLINGRGANGQGDCLSVYPITVKNDGIYVGFNKPWWKIF